MLVRPKGPFSSLPRGSPLRLLASDHPAESTASASPASSDGWRLLLLLAVAACLFFVGLRLLALVEPDEGRNGRGARGKLASGGWVPAPLCTPSLLDKTAVV